MASDSRPSHVHDPLPEFLVESLHELQVVYGRIRAILIVDVEAILEFLHHREVLFVEQEPCRSHDRPRLHQSDAFTEIESQISLKDVREHRMRVDETELLVRRHGRLRDACGIELRIVDVNVFEGEIRVGRRQVRATPVD